jgi:hypothetical protein
MPVTTPVVPEDRPCTPAIDDDVVDLSAIWCDLGGSD